MYIIVPHQSALSKLYMYLMHQVNTIHIMISYHSALYGLRIALMFPSPRSPRVSSQFPPSVLYTGAIMHCVLVRRLSQLSWRTVSHGGVNHLPQGTSRKQEDYGTRRKPNI